MHWLYKCTYIYNKSIFVDFVNKSYFKIDDDVHDVLFYETCVCLVSVNGTTLFVTYYLKKVFLKDLKQNSVVVKKEILSLKTALGIFILIVVASNFISSI